MSLRMTAASSSARKPTLKRTTSSPFSTSKRKKPSSSSSTPALKKSKTVPETNEDDTFDLKLEDEGLINSLTTDLNLSDVVQLIKFTQTHQWSAVPESGTGMNSTRIAEILNFRRRLPPLVSVHHIHALSTRPTQVEREIGMLVNRNVIRRIPLPPQETGGSSPGEALVLVEDWVKCMQDRNDIQDETKEKYCSILRSSDMTIDFDPDEIAALARAGFLVGSSYLKSKAESYLQPGATLLGTLDSVSKAGIQHVAGSAEAVASNSVHHISGGSGFATRVSISGASGQPNRVEHNLSLPNIGAYLKLLHDSRSHLISLLAKSNRYRELPQFLLKERWDGGIAGNDEATKAQKLRGEWVGVVPGRTRKWKTFNGLEFKWVLEECLGAGMVECFKTGSVGVGVRAV